MLAGQQTTPAGAPPEQDRRGTQPHRDGPGGDPLQPDGHDERRGGARRRTDRGRGRGGPPRIVRDHDPGSHRRPPPHQVGERARVAGTRRQPAGEDSDGEKHHGRQGRRGSRGQDVIVAVDWRRRRAAPAAGTANTHQADPDQQAHRHRQDDGGGGERGARQRPADRARGAGPGSQRGHDQPGVGRLRRGRRWRQCEAGLHTQRDHRRVTPSPAAAGPPAACNRDR